MECITDADNRICANESHHHIKSAMDEPRNQRHESHPAELATKGDPG